MPRKQNGDKQNDNVVPLHDEPEDTQAQRSRGPALNRVELIGRFTTDAELRYTPDGRAVTNVRIATNERDDAEFHQLVAFGRTAEVIAQYLGKGRLVYVQGRLQTREYVDGQNVKRWRTEIVVHQMQILDRKPDEQ